MMMIIDNCNHSKNQKKKQKFYFKQRKICLLFSFFFLTKFLSFYSFIAFIIDPQEG